MLLIEKIKIQETNKFGIMKENQKFQNTHWP